MTTILFLAALGCCGCLGVGILVGYRAGAKQTRYLKSANHRRGVVKAQFTGSGPMNKGSKYHCTFLVRELEDLGNGYSRVEIEEVTGVNDNRLQEQVTNLLGNVIEQNRISWSDPLSDLKTQ